MFARRLALIIPVASFTGLVLSATHLLAETTPNPADSAAVRSDSTSDTHSKTAAAPPATKRALPQDVRQEITHYRAARTKPKQQAAALKTMAALGDAGLAAAKDLLEKEIQQAEAMMHAATKPTKLDESVTRLRKTLADLRHDPNLSKDQLHKIGEPAFDELKVVYFQRAAAMAGQSAKNARLAESLRQLVAVLELCRQQWLPDEPLPVNEYRSRAQSLLSKLASPEEEKAREILARNQAVAAQFPADLRSGMDALNTARIILGLDPLLYDGKLCKAAQSHCKDMAARDYFSHESPVESLKTPWDRAKAAGTTASGENIYKGSSVSTDALKAWFFSPGHHKNMFSESASRQGLGHEANLWTLMIGSGELDAKTK
jgi:uncharacterized protein YkwD